jgi:signal transduction histidine kinase
MPETTAELKYVIERQREELKTINEVGRLLSSATEPLQIVRLVASYLHHTFPLAMCAVLLTKPRRLQIIRFATIAQVDYVAAIRTLCDQTSQLLKRPVTEAEFERLEEDQGLSSLASGPIGYLRSSHAAPLAFDGKVAGLLAVFSGKTEAFSAEDQHVIATVADQLRAALRNAFLLSELTHANQLKNELLMVISHELRIPLTSIKEGVNLVLEGALGAVTADQQDFLNTVNQNADRLETLVAKVVTASQLVTGQVQYTPKEMDVAEVLKELRARFEPAVKAKNIGFEVAGIDQPVRTQGDSKRLAEALGQLVENAVQATSEGSVTVSCADGHDGIEIQVVDTGVGIPDEALPTLFQQFRFVGGPDDRKTGGLGLGLFIAKAFIEVHGGTVRLESQLNKGTRVVVRLPRKAACRGPLRPLFRAPGLGRRKHLQLRRLLQLLDGGLLPGVPLLDLDLLAVGFGLRRKLGQVAGALLEQAIDGPLLAERHRRPDRADLQRVEVEHLLQRHAPEIDVGLDRHHAHGTHRQHAFGLHRVPRARLLHPFVEPLRVVLRFERHHLAADVVLLVQELLLHLGLRRVDALLLQDAFLQLADLDQVAQLVFEQLHVLAQVLAQPAAVGVGVAAAGEGLAVALQHLVGQRVDLLVGRRDAAAETFEVEDERFPDDVFALGLRHVGRAPRPREHVGDALGEQIVFHGHGLAEERAGVGRLDRLQQPAGRRRRQRLVHGQALRCSVPSCRRHRAEQASADHHPHRPPCVHGALSPDLRRCSFLTCSSKTRIRMSKALTCFSSDCIRFSSAENFCVRYSSTGMGATKPPRFSTGQSGGN